ncbi:MAG: TetR/AcrR family transcriptional regulator [Candidatus Thorarchaeota archaeon]
MGKRNAATPKSQRLERARKQRRDAIVSIARDFFASRGYEQTMVEEIAHEAGYTKMTIYNYFESKEDLFIAAVSMAYKNLFETMANHLNQAEVSYELRSMGDAYLAFFNEYPDDAILFESGQLSIAISKILKREEANEALTESEQEFRHYMDAIEKLMTGVITETMKMSGVQDKVDPFAVIMVLSTFAQTIRELILRGKRTDRPEEKTEEYLSVFFNIIDQGLKHYDD